MNKLLSMFLLLWSFGIYGQTGSEIYLFDMSIKNGQVLISNGKNVTNHKGYDNQPFFHPSKPILYFSSFDDSSRSDLKYYDYQKNETANLTLSREREYSPTVTPDGKFISCIIQRDNGMQDLGKYPVNGGNPEVLINSLKIGYHAWADNDKLILFVLGDSNTNTLHYYDLGKRHDTILSSNIGRSLHRIPGQHALSFVQKTSEKEALIQRFDPGTMSITNIVKGLPGQDQLTWLQDGIILMSDGSKLFAYPTKTDKGWQEVIISGDVSMLKTVTRLATNTENNKLAVVVSE